MTESAKKWNNRYAGEIQEGLKSPRQLLLDYAHLLPRQGCVLDLAMGLGANAGFLHQRGLHVIGVDISTTAALNARQSFPDLPIFVADLESWHFNTTFDIILNFYYFQRNLALQFSSMLNPGGWLLVETLHWDILEIKPDINPDYLVKPRELLTLASGFDVYHYFEGWIQNSAGRQKCVAQLVAKKEITVGENVDNVQLC